MSKIVNEFLADVKAEKVKQLLGITLDKRYWNATIEGKDANKLREDLGQEKEKMVSNAKGKVMKDDRDLEKINRLSKEIDAFEKAVTELARLDEMEKGIKLYMDFIMNPTKIVLDELEGVAKL